MFRRSRVTVAAGLVVLLGALALAQAGSGHPTSNSVLPHWNCRASASYLTLAGSGPPGQPPQQGHVEPAAANGNATTGADADECHSDDAGFPNPTIQQGNAQGSVLEEAPFAQTRINSDFSYKQTATAKAGVQNVVLSGNGHSLQATVVRAEASGSCQNGRPVLSGASSIANLVIDGKAVGPDDGTKKNQAIVDNPNFKVILDEETEAPADSGGKNLTRRALHVRLAQDENNYLDVVVGEAKVGYHGDATQLCTAPPARCPDGASYDQTRGVCVVTVNTNTNTNTQTQAPCPSGSTRDASGACVIVVGPPSTQPGTGGNVVPLQDIRGVKKTSPCRNKRFGRQVGIVGTARADRITGSNRSDRIFVFGGNDRVSGGRGNECIEGGAGSDQLDGSTGSDWLLGGAGNDHMGGGSGSDYLYGGSGNDKLIGGTGNDRLYGGPGRNKLDGGKGNDLIVGGPSRDYIVAGNGRDVVRAGKGNDDINVATAGVRARVDCGPGRDTVRINNNELRSIKHCENVLVTTRLSRLKSYNESYRSHKKK